jgi:hypothetical protein
MADVTSANVTLLDHWTEGGLNGKRLTALKVQVAITAAGSGATGGKIPASAFGLREVEQVSNTVKSDNTAAHAMVPNANGSEVLSMHNNSPANITGTYNFIVKGQTLGVN